MSVWSSSSVRCWGILLLPLGLLACADKPSPVVEEDAGIAIVRLTQEELMDPEKCSGCHPMHYRQWKASMHAYAADDPVFIAMNNRGQRETNGQLGDFCLQCHAPMAVQTNLPNRNDIASIPRAYKGVTCYFCHNATGHSGDNNAQVNLAGDNIMRGPIGGHPNEPAPVDPGVHGVAYSRPHDPWYPESAGFCGSCHDVVTPAGVHMERTLQEWNDSIFSAENKFQSCQSCHMKSFYDVRDGRPIATPLGGQQFPPRVMHEHLWQAVDVALTDDWPDQEAMLRAVACELKTSLALAKLSVDPAGLQFSLYFETQAGHAQPSGAAQDRRMWVEAVAYDAQDNVVFQTGVIGDGEIEEVPKGQPGYDPNLAMMRDHVFDAQGNEVHMFWEAEPSQLYPDGYKRATIRETTLQNVRDHGKTLRWQSPVPSARIKVRIRLRPMGMDVLESLVKSGDLDPSIPARMPTFDILEGEWKVGDGAREIVLKASEKDLRCPKDYACIFDPALEFCR